MQADLLFVNRLHISTFLLLQCCVILMYIFVRILYLYVLEDHEVD